MTPSQWVETIHRLNEPAERQYQRCERVEKMYGTNSRQARVEYQKYAAILTSIGVEHYRIWLEDYTTTMIEMIPKIGKQAVLDNFARLRLSCDEWQEGIFEKCCNRIASVRTIEDSILNVQVSGYNDYYTPQPISINLLSFLRHKKYADKVTEIRATLDKSARDAMKATLPCITPSGTFTKRMEENLTAHSGFIQFDIDAKDNPAYFEGVESTEDVMALCESIKSEISKQPFVAYAGLSVSGRGLWGLIPISEPSEHKAHFASLVLFFANMGIALDKAPSNVASLRGYSFDQNAYFNHSAEQYTDKVYPVKNEVRQHYQPTQTTETEKVGLLVKSIVSQRIDITGGYLAWIKLAFAFSAEFGDSGREFFHEVSQFHPQYSYAATNKKFDQCLKAKAKSTIATFYAIAAEHGVKYRQNQTA